jgi:hypothetical protein
MSTLRTRVRARLTIAGAVLAFLAFVAGLLFVSDALSRVGAQSLIARAVQREVGTPTRPSVHLRGAFFLPQVVGGVYDDVSIDLADVRSEGLRIATLHADLRKVHLPFHDVLIRKVRTIVAERTDEYAVLTYRDLDAYLRRLGNPVTVRKGSGATLRVTGTIDVLGSAVSASADVRPSFSGTDLELTPTQLQTGNSVVNSLSRLLLAQRLRIRIPLGALPFGQRLTGAVIQRTGVVVHATGTGVLLSG